MRTFPVMRKLRFIPKRPMGPFSVGLVVFFGFFMVDPSNIQWKWFRAIEPVPSASWTVLSGGPTEALPPGAKPYPR